MDGRRSSTGPGGRSLSLVIPAYNEEAGIAQAIAEADRSLAGLVADYEILVVDDGSSDGTAEAVRQAAVGRPRVRLLQHAHNYGYSAALRTGFEAARGDLVAFTDADCQFYLEDLGPLIALAEQTPLAVGYRLDRQDPWRRRFLSWGYNTLVRTLLGTRVRDCDCALKVFRRDALLRLLPQTPGFFVNTEMLTRARQLGLAVSEQGVRHRPRLRGASTVSLGDVPRTLRTLLGFWWTAVLFPTPQADDAPAPTVGRLELPLCALVLAAFLLCFLRLGSPLQEPEESRYAEIPRQMLEADSLLVPLLNGAPYLDKPPLLYWLVLAGYRVLGVEDWVARLVPSLATFLTILVTYAWGRHALGWRAAFAGAGMLCLSARFLYLGRLLTMNSLLCLGVVAAWATAQRALAGPGLRWRWWLASALACGLGCLAKGPVALALATGPMLAYLALDGRAARPRPAAWAAYLGLVALVAGPWYLALAVREPEFVSYFFWTHNVVRFLAPFDHEEPVWFYLPGVLLGMLPWSLLLPGLVKYLARRAGRLAAARPAALGFFLLAAAWSLVFFSLAGSKRAGYILPAMPPLALALGYYLSWLLDQDLAASARALLARRAALVGHRLTQLVLALGMGGAALAMAVQVLAPTEGIVLAGACGLGLVAVYRRGCLPRAAVGWSLCGGVTFALLLAGVGVALPGHARRFSLRGQLRPQAGFLAETGLPVRSYPRHWDSVAYYLRPRDLQAYGPESKPALLADLQQRHETLLVVKTSRALADLLRDLPASHEFIPRGRQGTVTVGLVRQRQ